MRTWGYDSFPRLRSQGRYPTARLALPTTAAALAIALALIAVPMRSEAGSCGVALGAVSLSLLLFALPSRRALVLVALLAAAVTLVFAALYAARHIGAL